jgi:predicted ATPase
VTLTGSPGTGKTRLALQIAGQTRLGLPDHVVFVGLASVAEPRLVLSAVAQALGLQEQPGRAVFDQLVDGVSGRDLFLVLDNFEHVVGAAAELTALLTACPALRVLVTSRERLRVSGEQAYAVTPLDEPDAVRLFAERAHSARADFSLTAENTATVAAICDRVDRLPLAIELAAGRVRLFGLSALLARLDRRLTLLSDGPRDHAPRQQALRDTIAWSFDLLEPAEQVLLSKLAVCVGNCSLATIEALCGADQLSGLGSLVDKSLLHQEPGVDGEPRFVLLETVRVFALERLDESGLTIAARRAHARYFRLLAESAEAEYFGPADGASLDLLEQDYANLRAAIEWSLEDGDLEVGLALGGALWRFLFHRDHLSEGRDLLRRLIAAAPAADVANPSPALAKALFAAASLAVWQGESPAGRADANRSVALYRALGDKRGEGYALHTLAHTAGDRTTERDLYAESVIRLREAGDMRAVAWSLQCLGNVTLMLGDLDAAHAVHSEGLAVARLADSPSSIAGTLTGLGSLAERAGDHVRAYALYLEGFELRRKQSDRAVTDQLNVLGRAALGMGEPNLAAAHFAESLELCRKQGIKWDTAYALTGLAEVELRRGQAAHAATLLAAADALLDTLGAQRSSAEQVQHERMLRTLRETLGESRFQQALATGRTMTRDQAIHAALLRQSDGTAPVPG